MFDIGFWELLLIGVVALLVVGLLPVVLLLEADAAHGFAREWRPVYGTTPDKHRAYAMQWFTLAAVTAS